MAYQDTWAICTKCGKKFVFRIEDQRQQAKQGQEITPPELCPACSGKSRPKPVSRQKPKETTEEELGSGPHEGSVKWYDSKKGYGFIVHPDGNELFFHRTGIAPGESHEFPDDVKVTYLVEQTEKGPQAIDVARMD